MLGSLFNSARVTILDGKKVTIFTHHKGHKSRSSQDSRVTHPQGHKSPVWMCDWFGHLYLVPCTASTLYCGPPWKDFSLFRRSLFLLLFFTILIFAESLKTLQECETALTSQYLQWDSGCSQWSWTMSRSVLSSFALCFQILEWQSSQSLSQQG